MPSDLPAGTIPTLDPAAAYQTQANTLLLNMLVADGTASNTTAAQAWVATQSAAQVASYLRSKSADALLTTVLTRLAPLGLSGSNPIPEGTVLPTDPIASINAGRYLKVPILAGNTRDEAKLFPTFLALSPALGGVSGRLLGDAAVFPLVRLQPERGACDIDRPVGPGRLPAGLHARHRVHRTDRGAEPDLLPREPRQRPSRDQAQQPGVWYFRFDWDEEPAPFNDIFGAAHGFEMPFVFGNFGPSLYANFTNTKANLGGRLSLSDAMMRSIGAFARNGDPNNAALGVAWPAWPAKLVFDANATTKVITVQ